MTKKNRSTGVKSKKDNAKPGPRGSGPLAQGNPSTTYLLVYSKSNAYRHSGKSAKKNRMVYTLKHKWSHANSSEPLCGSAMQHCHWRHRRTFLQCGWVCFFFKKLFPTISLTASKTNRLSRQAMVHKTVDLERKQYSESHVRGL